MRIWIFNHYAITPDMPGGTRHFALARELVRLGHSATIIASNVHYSTGEQVPVPAGRRCQLEEVGGVNFVWVRTPAYRGNSARRVLNMVQYARGAMSPEVLRAAGARPDVVMGSSPHLFAALAAQRVARRFDAPFVLEIRDLWPQSFIDLGILKASHPLVLVLSWIERFLYRNAGRIVSLLPGAADHMVEKGAAREHIAWIPNGVDLDLYPPEEEPAATASLTVTYAGAHGQVNALDTLLNAAIILRNRGEGGIRFVLVGDGPEKPRLQSTAREQRLNSIEFRPPVAKNEIPAVLRAADALVVTARDTDLYRHGISFNKLFDYLAAGRPIVFASSAVNNPVAEAEAGFTVPPEDPEALADALLRLSRLSAADRSAMGRRGREHVETHYSMRMLARRIESLLREVHTA